MLFNPQTTLNCNGQILDLSEPIVMGILNVTPDSFYDGGKFSRVADSLAQTQKMLSEGAAIIDIGAASSRPGAKMLSADAELELLMPTIEAIMAQYPDVILSCDTYHSAVAKTVIEAGVRIINDISGGAIDEKLWPTIAQYRVPYVLMHNRGTPENMQQNTDYEDVVKSVIEYFVIKIEQLRSLGINDIVLDIGFGFAKTLEQNYELLRQLHLFQMFELPILAGISRKSMIYKLLNTTPQNALNGTTVLNTVAIQKGASILRVHDVREAVETIQLLRLTAD